MQGQDGLDEARDAVVEHRSLRRGRQDVRAATACSTKIRIFA